MKKNVLQFFGSFHQGGSERQAVQLFNLLAEDATYNVFAAALDKNGVLSGEIKQIDFSEIQEYRLTSFYDSNFLSQLRNSVRFLRKNNIDIVHTHDFYTNVFGITAAKLAGVPIKIASKRETGGMRSGLQKIIEKQIFKVADAIVANSKAVKNYLLHQGVSTEKIEVIYNGLDLSRLTPKETDRVKICAELGLPNNENIKFITSVANLRHRVKNQPMFLRAAKKVSDRFPEARFVIAGEGELKSEMENLARELEISKKTHFIGRCEKIPELLLISNAGVLTSFAEGFSNSILEYMSAKLPVVATRAGGAGEVIVENENGFLVESDDDAALANRLIELLQNPEKAGKMGELGRKTIEKKFSCQEQLSKTIELYASRTNEK